MQPAIRIEAYLEDTGALPTLAEDVRLGLTKRRKSLHPKYLYDDRGSQLFEEICGTPEYYLTRTEKALLDRVVPDIVRRVRPRDLVELGPGSSFKTRAFLDAMQAAGTLERYIPVDVSLGIVEGAAQELAEAYPGLRIRGVIGDFHHHLDKVPSGDRQLVIFLGSTIGNLSTAEATGFLRGIAATLGARDALLVGADLVKERSVLEAAYNDAQGVTARFNRNVLRVINRNLDADFDLESFEHVAFFNPRLSRIEIYLEARREMRVRIEKLDLEVRFKAGERIHTEYSRKYTRRSLATLLQRAGLVLEEWHTDPKQWFGLALARRRGPR